MTANTNEKFYENEEYVFFLSGEFSQWFIAPFTVNDITFNCCEQYMMYNKAITFGDSIRAELILNDPLPKNQKQYGREVIGFNEDIWNQVADEIVFKGNLAKFSQNENLKAILIATDKKKIVEAAPYDKIWGNGLNISDSLKTPETEWKGKNKLGKAIMRVREILINN